MADFKISSLQMTAFLGEVGTGMNISLLRVSAPDSSIWEVGAHKYSHSCCFLN